MILRMKPSKTDQAGTNRFEKTFEKTFVRDEDPHALSAAHAVMIMLALGPTSTRPEDTPLFRDRNTGKEESYQRAKRRLKDILHKVELEHLATGCHYL